jgi:DNA polymerase III delta' subunit
VSLSGVSGQPLAVACLTRAISSGRIGHAYLFFGPPGTGKKTAAMAFAPAINCAHPTSPGETCGECGPCRAFDSNSFPDLMIVGPEGEDGRERSFHTDQVGKFMMRASLMASPTHYKVFILEDVHLMSGEAANHFLKMLEEPPPRTVWLLLTSEPGKLLPTIRSRCQGVRFNLLSRATVEALLQTAGSGGAKEAVFMMGQLDREPSKLMESIGAAEGFLGMAQRFDLAGLCGWSKVLGKESEELTALLDGLERVCGEKLRTEPENAGKWISALDAVAQGRLRWRRYAEKTLVDSLGAELSLIFREGAHA